MLLKSSTRSRRGCCRGRVLGAVSSLGTEGLEPIRESQNTQSPRLRFCALLTEDEDRTVQLDLV